MKPIFLILAFLFSFHAYGISISQIMKEKSDSQYMITCADPTVTGLGTANENQPIIPTGGTVISRGSCVGPSNGGGLYNCVCSIQMGNKTYSCSGNAFSYGPVSKPANCALYSMP
jgi:hypothetical protein